MASSGDLSLSRRSFNLLWENRHSKGFATCSLFLRSASVDRRTSQSGQARSNMSWRLGFGLGRQFILAFACGRTAIQQIQ